MDLEVMEKRGQFGERKSIARVKDSTWKERKHREREDHESLTIPHHIYHHVGDTAAGLE